MKVIFATQMGMCFGVRDAILTAENIPDPNRVTIHGEIVHNPQVMQTLLARGFHAHPEADRANVPASQHVLVTAHGISNAERERLFRAGKVLVDTTCPLVQRVHQAAQSLQREGYFVVLIGRPGHVEVDGITGDLKDYAVVSSVDDVRRYDADRIGIVCQSTTPPSQARAIHEAIVRINPGRQIRFADTICRPTRERQEAALTLLERIDALVVVGGKHSNNTRQLGLLAESRGVPWRHVETEADIDPLWFAPFRVVGLTAGTSTPDSTIQSVHAALLKLGPPRPTTVRAEDKLPPRLV